MMTSNLRYLLCELNDENYTEPTFTVFDSHELAFKQAVERCTGVAYYYESDFELECKDNLNRISITFNKNPYGEDNNFYTTEIKEYDSAKGNYVLVWHHAYNGVGFDVELVGTYEECKQKMIDSVHKREMEIDCELDFQDNWQSCIDTGDEWEVWTIVKLEECK